MLMIICKQQKNDLTPSIQNKEAQSNNGLDKFEEIKKYKELLDVGIITQKEFESKKKELSI